MIEEEKFDDDFLESLKEENSIQTGSQDSFGKVILKAYEEHKKAESKINQRPISSYHNNNQANNLNKEDLISSSKQKPQSAHPISSNNSNINKSKSSSSKTEKECDKNFEEIITDLKKFIEQYHIKKSDFIDNENLFLSFEDFKSQLHSIHYIIPKEYVRVLFNNNNEGAKDDYISMAKFLKYLYDESEESSSIVSQSNLSSLNSIQSKEQKRPYSNKKIDKFEKEKNIYNVAFINEEFSKFNKDINDIIRTDSNKMYNYNNYSTFSNKLSNYNSFKQRPGTAKSKLSNYSSKINIESKPITISHKDSKTYSLKEEEKIASYMLKEERDKKSKYSTKEIIKKRNLEKLREDEKIRKQFEKRRNDFRNECLEKCAEMNKICEVLGLNKTYKLIPQKNFLFTILKKNSRNKIEEIDVKKFDIEYRRLNKLYKQRDVKERYSVQEQPPKKDMETIVKERQNEKNEKKKDIKEVLIEAVRLKTKLKNQLDNLKSKVKIDEKVVIEQLLKAGIEMPKKNNDNNENK